MSESLDSSSARSGRNGQSPAAAGSVASGARAGFAVFAHLNADKSVFYRAILDVFRSERERFAIVLRPTDVEAVLRDTDTTPAPNRDQIETALRQLVAWGNLDASRDTAEVATVEEFYRPRYLYQLSAAGEAAERALEVFEEHLHRPGELQTAALHDILDLLGSLEQLVANDPHDGAKLLRTLQNLGERFTQLTSRAQSFLRDLQATADLHGIELSDFLEYKDRLIEYLERFIGELVLSTNRIANRLMAIERLPLEEAVTAAARRELIDAIDAGEDDIAAARQQWLQRWRGLRRWFIAEQGASQAELLRARARSAIPALLTAISNLNDRRAKRADRAADFHALARWFASAPAEEDLHRLWRTTFGLSPARHLRINDETLDAREAAGEGARTSWLEGTPLWVTPRLRKTGRNTARGPARQIIDRSREKQLLADVAARETEQIEQAREVLAQGKPMRLSELSGLDRIAFGLFLELLGEALARKEGSDAAVETHSADGALHIRLVPYPDGGCATLETEAGYFSGPDHRITVTRTSAKRDRMHPL